MKPELLWIWLLGVFAGSFGYRLWRNSRQERRGQYPKPPYPHSTARERGKVPMNETITIGKAQLHGALRQWEQLRNEGGCRTPEETAELTSEQRVQESADYLWSLLRDRPAVDLNSDELLTGGTCEPGRPEGCESCQ